VNQKGFKTFEATWRIRMVLVREDHGWLVLFSTDSSLTAEEILSAVANRFTLEQDFHGLQRTWWTATAAANARSRPLRNRATTMWTMTVPCQSPDRQGGVPPTPP
jgi:hypothetical protein